MEPAQLLFEGKYEILAKLREGGMGTIYKVRHRLLDEIRVVKVMRSHVVADEDLKRRFLEEAKTATRLRHPNICGIYDYAADQAGSAYLVMEYIEGANLAELLRDRGPLNVPLTVEIGHQALLALGYLHRKGVVHRDVAPDNLMLARDDDGRPIVKLIDLGIAKAVNRMDMTASGVFLGKLKYASPEQFGALSPGEKLDGRSDLYGLGVVMYELLTGTRPYKAQSPAELLRAHLVSSPTPFVESDPEERVPPELRTVILRALQKKREQRFPNAEAFDQELSRLRGRFDNLVDLEKTAAILSNLRLTKPAEPDNVTPGAEEVLNQHFGTQATPPPEPSSAAVITARKADNAPTMTGLPPPEIEIDPSDSTVEAFPASEPTEPAEPSGPPRIPSRITSTPRWFLPTPRHRTLPIAVLTTVAAIGLILWHPWTERRVVQPIPVEWPVPLMQPTARARAHALPSHAPRPIRTIVPTSLPTDAPTHVPTVRATRVPTVRPLTPGPSQLRELADTAREGADAALQAADEVHARELAPMTYQRAVQKHSDGARLAASGNDPSARQFFDQARELYKQAAASAREVARRPTSASGMPIEASIPTTPAPVAAYRVDDPATRAVLDQVAKVVTDYATAQTTGDEKLFAQVFPSGIDAYRSNPKTPKAKSVRLEILTMHFDGNRATVSAYETRVTKLKDKSEVQNGGPVTLNLEKVGDRWVITGRI